jgi:hypothetical protein
MAGLGIPIVCVVTGEGGSGGALAIGVGNAVLMLEHAIYSVISPEGCAAILWGDASKGPEAADLMRVTAADLLRLGAIDGIVPEPIGGAHRNWDQAAASLRASLREQLRRLAGGPPPQGGPGARLSGRGARRAAPAARAAPARGADRAALRAIPSARRGRRGPLTRPSFDTACAAVLP